MDIREFYRSNTKINDQNNNNSTYEFNQNTSDNTRPNSSNPHKNQDFSEYQDTINKYKDLSQQDLYKELLTQASDLKAQGKLDNNTLNTISSTLGPMLNDEQRELLNNIINRLK